MRVYGKAKLKDRQWHVTAEPHVMIRLRRLFSQVGGRSYKSLRLSNTPEVCRDLQWFADRYPLKFEPEGQLIESAEAHREQESIVERLLSGLHVPQEFALALPPRSYQRTAADMLIATKRFLLGDDLGLGKTVSAICPLVAPGTTPALIVTLTHLTRQWEAEIKRFAPGLTTHILRKGQVLFGWHRQVYDIWTDRLSDLNPKLYTGSESSTQKQKAKEAFVSGASKVLIVSLRSGAGLDGLQHVCRTGVFGELDWSPGVHEQCGGRIHRDGQTDPVMLYYLISDSGSDPIVADVLGVKRSQIEGVRNPNADIIERIDTTGDHIKRLAEQYLKRRAA